MAETGKEQKDHHQDRKWLIILIHSFIHSYTHQTHIDCVISNTPSVNC